MRGSVATAAVALAAQPLAAQEPLHVGFLREWPVPVIAAAGDGIELPEGTVTPAFTGYNSVSALLAAVEDGTVDIALSVPLVPLVAAWTRDAGISVIGVSAAYPQLDQCVARAALGFDGSNPEVLRGESVAVAVSTVAHFALLQQFRHLGLDVEPELIRDLPPRAAAAAFEAGSVGIACLWGEPLQAVLQHGKPLVPVEEKAAIGQTSADAIVAGDQWLAGNFDAAAGFLRLAEAFAQLDAAETAPAIAELTGLDATSTEAILAANSYPTTEDQRGDAYLNAALPAYLVALSTFLADQGALEFSLTPEDLKISTETLVDDLPEEEAPADEDGTLP